MAENQKKMVNETAQTIKSLIAAVDKHPDDPQTYYNLGSMLTELKNYQQAEELFKKALQYFKRDEQRELLHYGLGNVFYASELYQEAKNEFQQITQTKLKTAALLMRAQTEYAQANYQISLAYALTAVEEGKNRSALMLAGENLLALGDFAQAKNYFDQLLEQWPHDKEANFQRGIVGMVMGEKSVDFFKRVEENDPDYFKKMKARLVDVEKFITAQKQKNQGGK
ncbi:tetratricopeptide repeat protein [Liquorilactobacillus capillatus]|nr:tetratricopeptide repeat protein [Liquorilactobacillus capillatus]